MSGVPPLGRDFSAAEGASTATRSKRRDPASLSEEMLAQIDAHTDVDAQVFAAALRLLLGRLRSVEQTTGASVLECIDWGELHRATSYIPGLWSGAGSLLEG